MSFFESSSLAYQTPFFYEDESMFGTFPSPFSCGTAYNYYGNVYYSQQLYPSNWYGCGGYYNPVEDYQACSASPYPYYQQSEYTILGSDGGPSMRQTNNADGSTTYMNLRPPPAQAAFEEAQEGDGWIGYSNPNPRPDVVQTSESHLYAVRSFSGFSDTETDGSDLSSHPTLADVEDTEPVAGGRAGDASLSSLIEKKLKSVSNERWERILGLFGPRAPDDYLQVHARYKKRSRSAADTEEETADTPFGETPFGWILHPEAPAGRDPAAPVLMVTDPSGNTSYPDDPVGYSDDGDSWEVLAADWDTIVEDMRERCPGGDFSKKPRKLPCSCFERRARKWRKKQARLSRAE